MLFPPVEISLSLLQSFKAATLQRCLLSVSHTAFHLAFPIRISDFARQRDRSVMTQHVLIKQVERGIVDIRREHALAEIIEDHDLRGATQPAEGPLVQLGPHACARTEHQKPNGFPAATEG